MGLFNFFGNYDKPGPGVNKDEPPKAAPIRFFEIFFRKFSKLVQLNLIFVIPTVVAVLLMVCLYFSPVHFVLQLPSAQLDIWNLYVVPLPLILLSPFTAGLTIVTRNYSREEHAFVWSDFWEAVKNNWKYFLLNGLIVYVFYMIMSFSLIYYYNNAVQNWFLYIPFWLCLVISLVFLFAQYYLPVMFITFDLKFGQIYKNALIFVFVGFGRNILLTVILAALVIGILLIPIMPLTVMLFFLLVLFLLFSFISYLINFTIYPIIDQYLIQPYNKKLEEEKYGKPEEELIEKDPVEEKFSGIFESAPEEEDDGEDKYVYINGKLVKKSELKPQEKDELDQ